MPWQPDLPFADEKPLADNESARTIALGDRVVPYVLRRSRRRSIGLQIDQRGLRVGAPQRATLAEVEALIRLHGDWVAQKLDEWRSRRRPELLRIADGSQIPLLGEPIVIHVAAGGNWFRWQDAPATGITLFVRRPDDAGRLLTRALRDTAFAWFHARLAEYCRQHALAIPPLKLSSARTRWGSCSRKSGIRLNWRLIHFPAAVIDYVIAHEIAHLSEMNHGPRFWARVGEIFPDYAAARETLNRLAAQCPQWHNEAVAAP